MAPIRTEALASSRREPKPPTGYNHKRIFDGLAVGAQFKHKYANVHEGPEPYHYPLPLPVPNGLRPVDPRGPSLTLADLECVRTLGSGGNGQVLLVRTRGQAASAGARLFALKALRKKVFRQRENSHIVDENSRERSTLADMSWNPFVAGLLQTFYDDRNVYMMLEYGPCGSFYDLMTVHMPMSPSQLIFYFANIVCGLEHLEKCRIVNRDLKPMNILVGADGYLILCDFGPSLPFPAPGDDKTLWLGEGTPSYQAPEAFSLEGQPADVRHGPAVDWWSAGIVLYEMTTGRLPFRPRETRTEEQKLADPLNSTPSMETWKAIMAGPFRWPRSTRVGRRLKDLVTGLLTVNANNRLGARGIGEVMQHPWLATVDWDKMRRKWYLPPFLGLPSPELKSFHRIPDRKDFPGLHFVS